MAVAEAREVLRLKLARTHRSFRSLGCTTRMPDFLSTVLIIAVVVLVADLVLAGGSMTMTGMSGVVGVMAHPLVAGALVAIVIILFILLGGHT